MNRNSRSNAVPVTPSAESESAEVDAIEGHQLDAEGSDTTSPPAITPQWQYWTPGPLTGVDIAWALIDPRRFAVRLYYSLAGGSGPNDSNEFASSLIVDTALGPDQTEVPFSVFEPNDLRPFLSGSFDYDPPRKTGDGTLTLRRLSYPGGAVENHVLYTDPVS
ncbi:MAG: hypothetical protein IPK97_01935 [Ahniella sp.]|nr:hypothetical protein [Ahniella sp.]